MRNSNNVFKNLATKSFHQKLGVNLKLKCFHQAIRTKLTD